MPKNQDLDRWRRPELILAELINKGARGEYRQEDDNIRIWYRALVVAVDVIGSKLENQNGSGELAHIIDGKQTAVPANVGPENPKNSIKARIITDGYDQFSSDDELKVFWPMMPEHDSIPIKPGEHAYVTFEDEEFEHGLWLGKVSGHSGVNFFEGESSFTSNDTGLNKLFDGEEETEDTSNNNIAGERLSNKKLNNLFEE